METCSACLLLVAIFLSHDQEIVGVSSEILCQYSPNDVGECGGGFGADGKGCCVPCVLCGPGTRKQQPGECSSLCIPCEEGFFSTEGDNPHCMPCKSCARIHRQTERPCQARLNTDCGACLPGYYEDPDLAVHIDDSDMYDCIKCTCPSDQLTCVRYCLDEEPEGQHVDNAQSSEDDDFPSWATAVVIVCLLATVVIAAVAVVFGRKAWKKRQISKRRDYDFEAVATSNPEPEVAPIPEANGSAQAKEDIEKDSGAEVEPIDPDPTI